jgi:hypothetical protein
VQLPEKRVQLVSAWLCPGGLRSFHANHYKAPDSAFVNPVNHRIAPLCSLPEICCFFAVIPASGMSGTNKVPVEERQREAKTSASSVKETQKTDEKIEEK